jgi:hypothetical protein
MLDRQRFLMLLQEQQQQQLQQQKLQQQYNTLQNSSNLLNSFTGSLNEVHHQSSLNPFSQLPSHSTFSGQNDQTGLLQVKCPTDLNGSLPQSQPGDHPQSSQSKMPTPKATSDNINWNSLSPYAHLQHLLVAN